MLQAHLSRRATRAAGRCGLRKRHAQAACVQCPSSRVDMARRFVQGAGNNILANLRYRKYRGSNAAGPVIDSVSKHISALDSVTDVASLMGYEGQIRGFYYDGWRAIDPRLDFGRRVRRPPNNPINCLISWFNGLTYTLCRNELAKTHLDDCMSFLHSPHEARSSLALDLSEVFKPVLADSLIFEIVLRGTDTGSWFHQNDGVCRLAEKGRKRTLEMWAKKIDDIGKDGQCFRDVVRNEALSIERHLLGVSEYKPWKRKI